MPTDLSVVRKEMSLACGLLLGLAKGYFVHGCYLDFSHKPVWNVKVLASKILMYTDTVSTHVQDIGALEVYRRKSSF